jgi:hypothetical protein
MREISVRLKVVLYCRSVASCAACQTCIRGRQNEQILHERICSFAEREYDRCFMLSSKVTVPINIAMISRTNRYWRTSDIYARRFSSFKSLSQRA